MAYLNRVEQVNDGQRELAHLIMEQGDDTHHHTELFGEATVLTAAIPDPASSSQDSAHATVDIVARKGQSTQIKVHIPDGLLHLGYDLYISVSVGQI